MWPVASAFAVLVRAVKRGRTGKRNGNGRRFRICRTGESRKEKSMAQTLDFHQGLISP